MYKKSENDTRRLAVAVRLYEVVEHYKLFCVGVTVGYISSYVSGWGDSKSHVFSSLSPHTNRSLFEIINSGNASGIPIGIYRSGLM